MASRFAHLRQRDNSVSMLRVKMSRRRSQSQKENRERIVNTRRQLEALQEMDMSALDASIAVTNMSVIQEKKKSETQLQKNVAGEERLKQLQRWKERKALEKEKEQREKSRKGVFKTGLYHPKDALRIGPLPPVPAAHGRAKEVSERAARSRVAPNKAVPSLCKTKGKLKKISCASHGGPGYHGSFVCVMTLAEPVTRGLSTRSVNKPPVTAAPVMKDKPKDKCAGMYHWLSEEMVVDQTVPGPALDDEVPKSFPKVSSFAPEGFLFQVPNGLSSIKFEPLTPRSAEAFLTPSFTLPPAPTFNEQKPEKSEGSPPKSPHCSPLSGPTTIADAQEEEPKHDVPYFRSEIANETNRLTVLCTHWESKVEDEAIPEEMRDCMRTAVGQARLLMKERFKQFSGLVDDCDFCRGEKITTCTDLQGFWDMVYFQVEDVNKKFDALKEAEGRGWMEDHKPLPRQRKVVKKPAAAPAPSKPAGTKAAAKSRLAAAKAAMKARQQATESEKPESTEQTSQDTLPVAQRTDSDGDFFQVASPGKPQGSFSLLVLYADVDKLYLQLTNVSQVHFTLSPCTEQLGSQAVSCTPRAVQNLLHTQDFVAATPDSSVTEVKIYPALHYCFHVNYTCSNSIIFQDIGVDFERYLQPSLRDSLSPRQPFPMESPMAMDVDLESPRGQPEESVTQQDAGMIIDSHECHSNSISLGIMSPHHSLLLFTPDLKDRIRQSVCPSDLMVFTPPL
uniref:Uncharacterized protein n=1 Tax=Periophthalmus magnuspinnatus TaxID=409849 RepID=A0A3B3ZIP4_9GOBI